MHAQQQRLNQEFMERSSLHATLWTALQEVVPHWNPRITRRFIQNLIPIWRDDLMPRPAQLRYLQLAMRLGWFDEAASARKWTVFIDLLDALSTQPFSMTTSLNVFNLIAALPSLPPSLTWNARLNESLCTPHVADAAAIQDCIFHVLSASHHDDDASRPRRHIADQAYFHLFDNAPLSPTGKRWLEHPWSAHRLTPVALLEPFGKSPWSIVSKLGLDLAGRLVAYDLPRDQHTPIDTTRLPHFTPDIRSSEPLWETSTQHDPPPSLPSPFPPLLLGPWVVITPELVASITLTGAVALFRQSS